MEKGITYLQYVEKWSRLVVDSLKIHIIGGHGIFSAKFFIAFLDVLRHAERFDAMLFLGKKNDLKLENLSILVHA